jgi:hypothetical protein
MPAQHTKKIDGLTVAHTPISATAAVAVGNNPVRYLLYLGMQVRPDQPNNSYFVNGESLTRTQVRNLAIAEYVKRGGALTGLVDPREKETLLGLFVSPPGNDARLFLKTLVAVGEPVACAPREERVEVYTDRLELALAVLGLIEGRRWVPTSDDFVMR